MYCRNCSEEIDKRAVVCPKCGTNTPLYLEYRNNWDSGSIGWSLLGLLQPLVGFILFAVWRKEKPKSAKMSLIGAIISIVLISLLIIFMVIAFTSLAFKGPNYYYH